MQLPPLMTRPSSKQLATSSDPSPQSSSSSSSACGGSSSGTVFSQHSHDADAAAMHRFITQGANSVNQPTSVLLARQRLMLQKLATAAEQGAQHDPHWAALKVKLEMQQAAVLRRLQVNNQVHEAQRQFTAIRLQDTQLKRPVAAKQTARASVTQRIIQELASEEAWVLQPTSSASLSDLYAMETDEPCEPCSAASDAFAPAQTASLLCGAQPTSSASTSCSCPDGVAACCSCMEADAEGNALLCTEACDYESACMPRCRPPRAPLPKARAPAQHGLAVPLPQPAPSCPLPASLQASNGAQVLQSRLLPPLSSRLNKSQQATTQAGCICDSATPGVAKGIA